MRSPVCAWRASRASSVLVWLYDARMTETVDSPGMSDSWRDLALHLRGVVDGFVGEMSRCLPGEPEECGGDYARHCMVYMACIKAKADDGLRHLHHGDPDGVQVADELYEHWLSIFAAESSPH